MVTLRSLKRCLHVGKHGLRDTLHSYQTGLAAPRVKDVGDAAWLVTKCQHHGSQKMGLLAPKQFI